MSLFSVNLFSPRSFINCDSCLTAPVSVCRCDTERRLSSRTFVRRYLNKHERQDEGDGKYLLNKAEQTLIVKFYSNCLLAHNFCLSLCLRQRESPPWSTCEPLQFLMSLLNQKGLLLAQKKNIRNAFFASFSSSSSPLFCLFEG